MSDGAPRISIVTPSYNQGAFLEDTIRSVLGQGYPNLEYVVIDGGSADGSVEIIRRYADRLAWWVSEPDQGQYDAINKGFRRTSGEVMAWLNSDDKYTPWALDVVGNIFASFPEIDWLTTLCPLFWDGHGRAVACLARDGFSRQGFFHGEHTPTLWYAAGAAVQQESTFWRRSLWERAGGCLDASLRLAGDFELWARFYQVAELYGVRAPIGGFRVHIGQKTAHLLAQYGDEARQVLRRHGGRLYGRLEASLRLGIRRCLPKRFHHFLRRAGLRYLSKECRYCFDRSGWVLQTS